MFRKSLNHPSAIFFGLVRTCTAVGKTCLCPAVGHVFFLGMLRWNHGEQWAGEDCYHWKSPWTNRYKGIHQLTISIDHEFICNQSSIHQLAVINQYDPQGSNHH